LKLEFNCPKCDFLLLKHQVFVSKNELATLKHEVGVPKDEI
jgi:hypothetical protein